MYVSENVYELCEFVCVLIPMCVGACMSTNLVIISYNQFCVLSLTQESVYFSLASLSEQIYILALFTSAKLAELILIEFSCAQVSVSVPRVNSLLSCYCC